MEELTELVKTLWSHRDIIGVGLGVATTVGAVYAYRTWIDLQRILQDEQLPLEHFDKKTYQRKISRKYVEQLEPDAPPENKEEKPYHNVAPGT